MTDEELRQKVVEHFVRLDSLPKCAACGHGKWEVAGLVAHPSLTQPNSIYPAVLTCCLRCGFFAFYSAKLLGVSV